MTDAELDQQQEQLRGQVLSAALALGLRTADVGEATPGAVHIQLSEDVLVAAITWKLRAQWNGPFAAVRLTGRPPRPEPSSEEVSFAFLVLFGAVDMAASQAHVVVVDPGTVKFDRSLELVAGGLR